MSLQRIPRKKIQLHSHFEGWPRHATIWEIAQKKNIHLHYDSVEDMIKRTKPEEGSTLKNYLKEMPHFLIPLVGDVESLERVAHECCQDQFLQGIVYTEVRLFPHLMASSTSPIASQKASEQVTGPRDVIDAVLRGFLRGERDFGIRARLVLACFRDKPEWAEEILDLCLEYQDKGVVGIDVCGVFKSSPTKEHGEELFHPEVIKVFQKAASLGIHRTVHAGEAGPPANIKLAMEKMCAERIGHGYAAIRENGDTYKQILEKNVHVELCPTSSYLTGAVKNNEEHPALRLARDNGNFSVNTDDPTITQVTMDDEYRLLYRMGLTEDDIFRTVENSLKSCFLPFDEKELIRKAIYETD